MPDRAFLLRHPAHFIAFGFGAGLVGKAPGTWGTLVAVPLAWVASLGGNAAMWMLAASLFAVGVWASQVAGKALGVADHGGIVIDEIAAFVAVLAFVPLTWKHWLLAFLLFRLFDIWKPWPIRWADRAIKGGFGVMFDDALAALFAMGAMALVMQKNWL